MGWGPMSRIQTSSHSPMRRLLDDAYHAKLPACFMISLMRGSLPAVLRVTAHVLGVLQRCVTFLSETNKWRVSQQPKSPNPEQSIARHGRRKALPVQVEGYQSAAALSVL